MTYAAAARGYAAQVMQFSQVSLSSSSTLLTAAHDNLQMQPSCKALGSLWQDKLDGALCRYALMTHVQGVC